MLGWRPFIVLATLVVTVPPIGATPPLLGADELYVCVRDYTVNTQPCPTVYDPIRCILAEDALRCLRTWVHYRGLP